MGDLNMTNYNVDPTGRVRGPCNQSRCRGYVSAESQDPFAENELFARCFRCGLTSDVHVELTHTGVRDSIEDTRHEALMVPQQDLETEHNDLLWLSIDTAKADVKPPKSACSMQSAKEEITNETGAGEAEQEVNEVAECKAMEDVDV